MSEDVDIAETFNSFFCEAVRSLDIKENTYILSDTAGITDPIDIALLKYEVHPSVLKIKETVSHSNFSFTEIGLKEVEDEIKNLNPRKANTYKNIPPKILQENADICSTSILSFINNGINTSFFPDELKRAEVTPIFKKEDSTNVMNYRPVSVLPVMSKVFERIMQKQINAYIEKFFSPYLCGFRKGLWYARCLDFFNRKMEIFLRSEWLCGFCVNGTSQKRLIRSIHELLIAKLHAYGFDKKSLSLINSYLTDRWQRVKIGTAFSSWKKLLVGVPQGSILGPLLF